MPSWGAVQGYRQGDNPARWKGHIEMILPAKSKVAKVKHHAALDYKDMPRFMASMRSQAGVWVLALRFVILTAARTGEVIGADWSEIDFENKVWIVPAPRRKAGREHRVPLSEPALEILERQREAWLDIEARRHRKTLKDGEVEPTGPVSGVNWPEGGSATWRCSPCSDGWAVMTLPAKASATGRLRKRSFRVRWWRWRSHIRSVTKLRPLVAVETYLKSADT